jgi:hypothetical protein
MNKYFVKNTLGYANTYDIVYTKNADEEHTAIENGYERITRRDAIDLCRAELDRIKYNPNFSGYSSTVILPVWYPSNERDWRNDKRMKRNGFLVVIA